MRIAITGGIACGKSTLMQRLRRDLPGYVFYDVDAEIRALYDREDYREEIALIMGTSERTLISDIVFLDSSKKKALEDISIKYLSSGLSDALNNPDVIVEYPLLFEMGLHVNGFDRIVAVSCSESTQRQRLKARSGFADEKIESILRQQLSLTKKESLSHLVINTEASSDVFEASVSGLISAAQIDSMRRQCLNDFESEAIWEAIYDAYKQSHRHYHTLMHIASMLAIFRRTGPLRYGVAVNFAIWFHDFVYETGSSSYPENESRSADAMVRLLRQYRPDLFASAAEVPRDVALAEAMILSTKKHQPIESFDTTWADAVVDCHVFLDIDLSILAKSEEVVLLFDDGIKKEFSQYPDDQFAAGRVQALSSFLLRDRVFYSKNFAGLEALARSNLNMLIARWSARKESK